MESVIGDSHDPAVGGELLAAPGNDPTHPEESSQKEPRWSARDGFRAPPVSDEAFGASGITTCKPAKSEATPLRRQG
jgi:hypothetical protein